MSALYSNIPDTKHEKKEFEILTSIIRFGEDDAILLIVKDVTE